MFEQVIDFRSAMSNPRPRQRFCAARFRFSL